MAIELYKNRCSVYEGEKPFIFISYSHQDIERVVRLIRRLQSEGFRIWYDSGIQAGAEWPEEVATHIKNCGCVLSLLSKNSTKSRHFKEEFNYAHHLQKPILVAYLENCELTPGVEMRVVSQQCIDCEHCENDEDLIQQIAQAKILLSCLGEKEEGESRVGSTDKGIADGAPAEKKENTTKPKADKPVDKIAQLRAKAEAGDPKAQTDLAWAYIQGEGVAQSYEEAVKWYRKAADQGDANAQYNLGVCYDRGDGVVQSHEEAVKWYRKAAEQGDAKAQFNLGFAYGKGDGVVQNYEEAVKWYRKAADQGDVAAQNNLGVCYERGSGVVQSYEEAVKWYRKAAEQGYARAQCNLGVCYFYGSGVSESYDKAMKWYRMAADQGNVSAQWNLGVNHEYGNGVPQDWQEAAVWYEKAAEQGYAKAQKKMARCYREGLGVPVDEEKAKYWEDLYEKNPDK